MSVDLEKLELAAKMILEAIGEDVDRDGLVKTPRRVAKSFEYICSGYFKDPKEVLNDALFESTNNEMVVVRNIEFYSMCEHHILPFFGRVHVAYIPDKKVVGLSKIPRMVNVFARRLQIQEQLTEQIADAIMEVVQPKGVGVVIHARHMCMEMRGVETKHSYTSSSALRGIFLEEKTREEFFNIINAPIQTHF
ncbi:GTP cyclohydrolase I [Nautilia profundicola AmH]|uniref:GTP cyclohydrolase 1 n=1 Tax=Nautilia profundicola (strain ATCC BAA-1463 / DSM 18972 / AmH) TaxID=598659 RepID=B9L6X5_NAUPA|nr:GTP cyclohydrolase I FolE [Nautilia profundicola]ACM92258.1 GTP cyclohydrolase I [Nautilia profundicola AmH]